MREFERDTMADHDEISRIVEYWLSQGMMSHEQRLSFRRAGDTLMDALLGMDAEWIGMMRKEYRKEEDGMGEERE